jgi:drug/metabolite transporter (DMT)-like permease
MTAPAPSASSATDRPDDIPRGIALVLLTMALFACQDAVIKHLTTDYSTAQILWVRYVMFAGLALALATRKRPLRQVLRSARPGFQVIRSLLILGDMACFVVAVRYLPLADAHSLIATFPLITTGLAAFMLKEQVGIRRWLAILACFVGVLIILRPGLAAIQPGALWALAAAVFFALYQVMTRVVSRDDASETSLLYMAITGAVATTVIGPFFWTAPDAEGWAFLVVLSIVGTATHMLLIRALHYAPASVLQPFNYTLLPWATLVGLVVFGQFPDGWTILGAAIVVASGLYTIWREHIRKQEVTVTEGVAPPPH